MENFKSLIQLDPGDNVLIACKNISAHKEIKYKDHTYKFTKEIGIGHKIASCDIKKGQDIVKFKVCIGEASSDIKKGEHVHVHNIKSKFILTHLREKRE